MIKDTPQMDFREPLDQRYYQYGLVLSLWASCKDRGKFKVISLFSHLFPAIELGQIEFIFDDRRNPTGYFCWAYLTTAVLAEMANDPGKPLHLSEWNEGDNIVLMDVCSVEHLSLKAIRKLKIYAEFSGKRLVGFRKQRLRVIRRGEISA